MSTSKIIIASALLLSENNELLVVRKQNSTFYMLPGGKVENNESHIDTLIRELREELNLQFEEKNFTFLGQHETNAVNEANTVVQGNIFILNEKLTKIPVAHAELAEVKFINRSEYEQFKLAHLLKEFALPIWLKL